MSVTLDLESRKVEAAVNDILDLLKEHSGIKLTSEQSIPVVNDDDDGQSRDNNLFYHLHDCISQCYLLRMNPIYS